MNLKLSREDLRDLAALAQRAHSLERTKEELPASLHLDIDGVLTVQIPPAVALEAIRSELQMVHERIASYGIELVPSTVPRAGSLMWSAA